MDTFMNGAMLVEATLMSILLALWFTWIGLRGLFRLMPGARLEAVPIRFEVRRGQEASGRHTA